jgi:hypothetical protein
MEVRGQTHVPTATALLFAAEAVQWILVFDIRRQYGHQDDKEETSVLLNNHSSHDWRFAGISYGRAEAVIVI